MRFDITPINYHDVRDAIERTDLPEYRTLWSALDLWTKHLNAYKCESFEATRFNGWTVTMTKDGAD